VPSAKKSHILFINQYYHPDFASTGQLMTQLTESLVDDFVITVVTSFPSYSVDGAVRKSYRFKLWSWQTHAAKAGDVRVLRVFSTTFSRRFLPLRALNYLSFFLSASLGVWFIRRVDLMVAQTDPPFIGFVPRLVHFLSLRSTPYGLIFQDVFPEVGVVLGKLGSFSATLLRWGRGILLRRAAFFVAISEGMRRALLAGMENNKAKSFVVANWVDTTLLSPSSPRLLPSVFQRVEVVPFIVMHSGNIGLSQDFELILDAAWYLAKHPSIKIVIVGDGARRAWLEQEIQQRCLKNVELLPYQQSENLSQSLGRADLHLVTLKPGLESYIVPSKVYGIMAVARPFVGVVAKNSEVHEIINKFECGRFCEAHPKDLAQTILHLQQQPNRLKEMGERGRVAAEQHFSRQIAVIQYKKILRSYV
jgi:glycosyltransferase involved in cell wall biosynthesis